MLKLKVLVQRMFFVLPLFMLLSSATYACEVGTIIQSTAKATYTINHDKYNTTSNTVEVVKVAKQIQTQSKIEFFKYSPQSDLVIKIDQTSYINSGQLILMEPLTLSNSVLPVVKSTNFNTDELILIMLTNHNRNLNSKIVESLYIQIENSTLDKEIIKLIENEPNSGQFIGYINITLDKTKQNIIDGNIFVDKDTNIKITELLNNSKSRNLQQGISKTVKISKYITLEEFEELESKEFWITNSVNKDVVTVGEHIKCNIKIETEDLKNIDGLEVHMKLPRGISIDENSLNNKNIIIKKMKNNVLKFKINKFVDKEFEFSYLLKVGVIEKKKLLLNSWVEQKSRTISNFSNVVISVKKDLDRTKAFIFGKVTGFDKVSLEGVKLYLENGMSTITDKDGKYHFEGVKSGAHVVQLDIDNLENTMSQFVDLQTGGIKRVDFIVKEKPKSVKTSEHKILTKKSPKMPQYNPIDITKEKLKWLWPKKRINPPIPSIKVAIQHDRDDKLELYLNNIAVNLLNYDGRIIDPKKRNVISVYRGVDIEEGDNILTAKIISSKGKVKNTIERKIHLSTTPVAVKLLEDKSFLVADGKNSPVIAVKLIDDQGYPLREDIQGAFTVDAPYSVLSSEEELSLNPISKVGKRDRYIIHGDGIAYIKLSPTTESGEVKLHFNLQNRDEVVRTWLKPKARDWLIVGFADGTLGFNTIRNNMKGIKEDHRLYRKGQVAFFAKGKIKGDFLLTLAYDSGKQKDLELFENIDPDEYYTIYQDQSEQKYEAQSKRRLYLKIEKDKFYMLFGDIKSDLDVNELSRYKKILNGIKSEYKGKRYEYSAFISDTKNIFIKDEIQGDGTSGVYRLKNRNIIVNSEMITVEVRDRYRDEKILDTLVLNRYRDYSIDYDSGEIYFKEPIFSQDDFGNLRFIVVDYEIEGDGESRYTYGGRGAVKFKDEKITIGSTFIKENNGKRKNQLLGIDSTVKINNNIQIKGEYATTISTLNDQDIKGDAFLVEARYDSNIVKANVYMRQEKNAFGLGQQKESTKHRRKSGFDATLNYWKYVAIKFLAYEDKDLNSDDTKKAAEAIARFKKKHFVGRGGIRYSKNNNLKSTQLIAGLSKSVFYNKIKLNINHEYTLQNRSDEFPSRTRLSADYAINSYIDLFLMNEQSNGDLTKLNQSRLGIKSRPWNGSQITSDISGETKNDSYKLYNNLGITQKWQINKKVSVNGGVERKKSIKSDDNSSDDFTAYSASINYNNAGYSYNTKVEYRDGKEEEKINIDLGLYTEIDTDLGVVFGIRSNSIKSSTSSQHEFRSNLSLAYRPQSTWLVLNRFDFVYLNKSNDKMKKFINNLMLNYKPIDELELSLQYGLKYIQENIDDKTFDTVVDLLGVDIVYDISVKYELGLHASALHSYQSKQIDYSLGLHTGYNVTKNSWLALGYNLQGFNDSDFSSQNYRAQGPYIQIRVKFDQLSLKETLNQI